MKEKEWTAEFLCGDVASAVESITRNLAGAADDIRETTSHECAFTTPEPERWDNAERRVVAALHTLRMMRARFP